MDLNYRPDGLCGPTCERRGLQYDARDGGARDSRSLSNQREPSPSHFDRALFHHSRCKAKGVPIYSRSRTFTETQLGSTV